MDNITKSHLLQINQASQQGKLIVFVGSGVSANSGVPTWNTLIDALKKELPEYLSDEHDFLKVAQLYKELRGEKEYLDKIKEILQYGKTSPNEIHRAILDLNPRHIITTNYDTLLEQACMQYNKQYFTVCKDEDLPCNKGEKLLIKMHGDFATGNIVLTENDYFDYSRKFPLIRAFVVSLFASNVVLFTGFSFNDINLKYILRQVNSVLHDNMQRAYLISDEHPDALIENYYKEKGVCIVSQLADNKSCHESKGAALISNLRTLLEYDPFQDDIIPLAMQFWGENGDQVGFLGEYMKYVIPRRYRKGFWLRTGDLKLPTRYAERFKEQVATPEGRSALKDRYGDKIIDLAAHITNNEVLKIEDFDLQTIDGLNERYVSLYQSSPLDLYYKMDLINLCNWIKAESAADATCSKRDLQLPYILYKTGKYYESYSKFKELVPMFWKSKKFFLYFICLYNMKTLARLMNNSFETKPYIDDAKILERIENIDMQKMLSELPLDNALREVLNELFNFDFVNDIIISASDLKQQIHDQRKNAEKGGISFNNNINELLYNYYCLSDFGNENHIIYDTYKESHTLHAIICNGIIDSIMIPQSDTRPQSKLTMLPHTTLRLFLFKVKTDDLYKLLTSHATSKLPAAEEFKSGMAELTRNLAQSIAKDPYLKYYEVVDRDTIINIIERAILLCTYLENPPTLEGIYTILPTFPQIFRRLLNKRFFFTFLDIQKPTSEEAVILIQCLVKTPIQWDADTISRHIHYLASIVSGDGKVLEEISSIKQLSEDINLRYVTSLYPVVSKPVQEEIRKYIEEKAECLYDYIVAELETGAHILTPDIIEQYKDKIESPDSRYFSTEEGSCKALLQLTEREEYFYLKDAVDKLATQNTCMQFMKRPLSFGDNSKIKGEWLDYCNDEELHSLLCHEDIRHIAKEYIAKNKWNEAFKERVWQLL